MFIPISCIRLSEVLSRAKVSHVNFFILDVEGGELSVLQSIDWTATTFDVICIETEEIFRPLGYVTTLENYLAPLGYVFYASRGRNSWFTRMTFVPSLRPGLSRDCFRGVEALKRSSLNYIKETSLTEQKPLCPSEMMTL
jgi:hypothetical protein